jgi:DNA-binding protein YbaB
MEELLGSGLTTTPTSSYQTPSRQEDSSTNARSTSTGRTTVGGVELPVTQSIVPPPSGSQPIQPKVTPVGEGATKVTSYMSGKEITRNSLKETVLESADLNAVALLDEVDLDTLMDTPRMEAAINDAKKKHDKTFDEEMEKVEKTILEKTDGDAIYGKQLPELTGNQIIINSERVLISSKTQETGIFSKKKFFVTTDDEITMDAKQRIVMRSDSHASIVSPSVHLGLFTTQCHPTLKGDCTTAWLSDLCGWLSSHVHHDPYITTSRPAQQGSLASLRARLPTLLSERIFISG